MFSSGRPLDLLRSVVCLSLLGVAVIVLIGPALAIAGVLLPFVLIGGLAWGAYRFTLELVRRMRGDESRFEVKEVAASCMSVPPRFRPLTEARTTSRQQGRFRSMMRTAIQVGIEVGCGAAIGAALCILVDWQTGTSIEHPALGATIGAVVGFVVGGTRPRNAAENSHDIEVGSSEAA